MAVLAGLIESLLNADADLVSIVVSAALAVCGVFIVGFIGNLLLAPVGMARKSEGARLTAESQRDEAERRLANRSSREQLADHLDEFAREVDLLRAEVPEREEDVDQTRLWEGCSTTSVSAFRHNSGDMHLSGCRSGRRHPRSYVTSL